MSDAGEEWVASKIKRLEPVGGSSLRPRHGWYRVHIETQLSTITITRSYDSKFIFRALVTRRRYYRRHEESGSWYEQFSKNTTLEVL